MLYHRATAATAALGPTCITGLVQASCITGLVPASAPALAAPALAAPALAAPALAAPALAAPALAAPALAAAVLPHALVNAKGPFANNEHPVSLVPLPNQPPLLPHHICLALSLVTRAQ